MAVKKSELYSSLWASCDELRGGMDASQYKDYVLTLLFVKYVSDKYSNNPDSLIDVPKGGGFNDLVALKGTKNIGYTMNSIIGKLAKANNLVGVIDVADFNDDEKLGKGGEMIETLSKLIAIFENPALDFSKNRAEGDDILGDAYEYLMRHFATESGKSKGQFYTPSEVSRVLAKVLNINNASNKTTFYDPTCGSGSLLLKAVDEAQGKGTIYGQEKDVATAALARMNMILHGQEAIEIHRGQSTLSDPYFKDKNGYLKTFDFIVANPPFSSKNWGNGFNPSEDLYGRFDGFGIPPDKNGDYAFLLHILKSLNSKGKAACILPHGVLFRGNAEAEIRKNIILRGYIKGIIGLPSNLFYGTGIPACIIILDKEGAENRKSIFMIDASKGFIKDGNKNRLREQDIHKIIDVFNNEIEIQKYSKKVNIKDISNPKNDFNLNIPRYIDSQEEEDVQDIEAHLLGGIPDKDIDALQNYWEVYPTLKKHLFKKIRKGYSNLTIESFKINNAIFSHNEFVSFSSEMDSLFFEWKKINTKYLKTLKKGSKPNEIINSISEHILNSYVGKALMDRYDVYQHLMNYWNETMQDDCYLIAVDGWKAEPYRIIIKNKQSGKETDKGWECDLVPKLLVIDRYFNLEKKQLERLEANKESIHSQLAELEEEHTIEDGYFADFDKINKAIIQKRLNEINTSKTKNKKKSIGYAAEPDSSYGEKSILENYLLLVETNSDLNKKIKELTTELDNKAYSKYKTLNEEDIKQLVVDDKWMLTIERSIKTEMERISLRLAQRIKVLSERYETTLPQQISDLADMERKVNSHLKKMGFIWN